MGLEDLGFIFVISSNENFHSSLLRQGRGVSTLRCLCHYVLRVGGSHREMTNVIPFAVFLSLPNFFSISHITFSSQFQTFLELRMALGSLTRCKILKTTNCCPKEAVSFFNIHRCMYLRKYFHLHFNLESTLMLDCMIQFDN